MASAPGLLTRPAFGPDIPAILQRNPLRNTATLAMLLLDAEILTESEWRRSRKHLTSQCERALMRWINERADALRCIRPHFQLACGIQPDPFHAGNRPEQGWLEIAWFVEYGDAFIVGPQVERLEREKKGLGLAALRALSQRSWRSFPMMMCQDQLSMAEWCFWGGESSIDDYIDMMELDPEDAEQVRAESIAEADIVAETPKWLLKSYRRKTPAPRTLKQIERRSSDPLARQVAEVLRMLAAAPELEDPHKQFRDDGGEFYGFSAYVRWSERDYTVEVAERMANNELNSGVGYEICGLHQQPIDDVDSFVQWMQHMDGLFSVTRLIDRLLWLLSGASSDHAPNTPEGDSTHGSNPVHG